MQEGQITELLVRWSKGDERALDEVMPMVYDRLRAMAKFQLFQERPGHTLQPTALVHEAYIKLAKGQMPAWNNRAHFLAVAARAMRQILVDYARRRNRVKGPGKRVILSPDEALIFADESCGAFPVLDEALKKLAAKDPRKERVVELKVFGGLTNDEIASVLDISANTVIRDWAMAKALLMEAMQGGKENDRGPRKKN